jgi:hypothetical protein
LRGRTASRHTHRGRLGTIRFLDRCFSSGGQRLGLLLPRELTNRRGEAVPASGDGDDVLVMVWIVVERLAERRNVTRKVVFLDDSTVPDQFEQRLLFDHAASVSDENHQHLERLQRQHDRRTIAVQRTRDRVGDERAKCVKPFLFARNRILHLGTSVRKTVASKEMIAVFTEQELFVRMAVRDDCDRVAGGADDGAQGNTGIKRRKIPAHLVRQTKQVDITDLTIPTNQ